MNRGWIKFHRKILESAVFQDDELFKLWTICLLSASHKKKQILVGKTPIELEAGDFVTGREALWHDFYTYTDLQGKKHFKPKKSAITVWRWLEILEKMQNLNIKSNSKFSVVSIINWNIYQGDDDENEQENEQQVNNKRTTDEQQVITNKNYKNVKNVKKKESISHSDTQTFLSFYRERFTEIFGTEPQVEWGKDGAITKKLLKTIPVEELKSLLEAFFVSEDKFIQGSGYTIGVFKSQINKLKIGAPKQKSIPKYLHGLQEVYDDIQNGEEDPQKAVLVLNDQAGDGIPGEHKQRPF